MEKSPPADSSDYPLTSGESCQAMFPASMSNGQHCVLADGDGSRLSNASKRARAAI